MKAKELTEETIPTLYTKVNGGGFTYGSFCPSSKVSLEFFHHFIDDIVDGNPGNTNEISEIRKVILCNNTGVVPT